MELKGKWLLKTWERSLEKVLQSNIIVPTERNGDTYELLNFTIVLSSPLAKLDDVIEFEKKRGINYLSRQNKTYWQAVNDRLINFNCTDKWVNQLEVIENKLRNSPINRQAYATIWSPDMDSTGSRPCCIVGLYFFIRNSSLNMTAILRSNDAWGQALNDIYHLIQVQNEMASRLDIPVGTYTHFAMSYHIYVNDVVNTKLLLEDGVNG